MPVHLGGAQYKMYFSHNTAQGLSGAGFSTKPVKIMYGDGARSSDPDVVDFEDWEGVSEARDILVLLPDGTEVSLEERSRFDDYVVLMPTNDPELQVLYTNMSEAGVHPFIGSVVLMNP